MKAESYYLEYNKWIKLLWIKLTISYSNRSRIVFSTENKHLKSSGTTEIQIRVLSIRGTAL